MLAPGRRPALLEREYLPAERTGDGDADDLLLTPDCAIEEFMRPGLNFPSWSVSPSMSSGGFYWFPLSYSLLENMGLYGCTVCTPPP